MFNTVCYGYLRQTFVDFIGFLYSNSSYVVLYTQYLRYNIFAAPGF